MSMSKCSLECLKEYEVNPIHKSVLKSKTRSISSTHTCYKQQCNIYEYVSLLWITAGAIQKHPPDYIELYNASFISKTPFILVWLTAFLVLRIVLNLDYCALHLYSYVTRLQWIACTTRCICMSPISLNTCALYFYVICLHKKMSAVFVFPLFAFNYCELYLYVTCLYWITARCLCISPVCFELLSNNIDLALH
jgi:hypothetical protein